MRKSMFSSPHYRKNFLASYVFAPSGIPRWVDFVYLRSASLPIFSDILGSILKLLLYCVQFPSWGLGVFFALYILVCNILSNRHYFWCVRCILLHFYTVFRNSHILYCIISLLSFISWFVSMVNTSFALKIQIRCVKGVAFL